MVESTLKGIVAALSGTRDATHPSLASFPELNAQQLISDLSLETKARNAGTGCRPAADAESLDAVEHEIVDLIESHGRRSQHEYHSALNNYQIRIQDSSVSDDAAVHIRAAGERAIATFKAQVKEDEWRLLLVMERARETRQWFRQFRATHGLTHRPPLIRSESATLLCWLLAVLLWLVETVVNGLYFAAGSEQGIIGGILVAASLSVLNVVVAMGQGLIALRYAFYRHKVWATLNIAFSMVLACVAVGLNAFIAAYRDSFVLTEGAAPLDQVLSKLTLATFTLKDTDSLLLFALGLVIHLLAVIDFWFMHDRYPGYGELGKRNEEALTEFSLEQTHCVQVLKDQMHEAIDDMQQVIELVGQRLNHYKLAVEFRVRLHRDYGLHLEQLKRVGERLVEHYRAENRAARPGGCDAPAYFRRPPNFLVPTLVDLPPIASHMTQAHEVATQAARTFITQVRKEFERSVAKLQSIDASSPAVTADASA